MKQRILSLILAAVMVLSLASMLAIGSSADGTAGLTLTLGSAQGLAGESVLLDLTLSAASLPATHDHLRCWQVAFSGASLDGSNEIYYSATGNNYNNVNYVNADENSVSVSADAGLNTGTAAQITAAGGKKLGSIGFTIPSTALPGDTFTVTISSVEALCFEDGSYNLYDEAEAVTVVSGTIEVMEDVPVEGLTVSLGTAYAAPGGDAKVEVFISAESLPYTHEVLRDWQFRFAGAQINKRDYDIRTYAIDPSGTGKDYSFINLDTNTAGSTTGVECYTTSAELVTCRGGAYLGTLSFTVPANATGEIEISVAHVDVLRFQDGALNKFDVKSQVTLNPGKIIVLDSVDGCSEVHEGEGEDYILPTFSTDGKTRITTSLTEDEEAAFFGEYGVLTIPAAITTAVDSVFDELSRGDVEKIVLKNTMLTASDISGAVSMGTANSPVNVYIHTRPNDMNDTKKSFDSLSSSNKKKVSVHNILEVRPEVIVDGNVVTFVAGIAVPDADYEDLTFELDFGGRVFAQATTKIYTTITGVASTNETTAATQSITYADNMTYLTAASVKGVPSGTYDVSLTLYGRTQDALGTLITVCSETVEVTVTVG